MSLLLDALKKAADDKIKNTANASSDNTQGAKTEREKNSSVSLQVDKQVNTEGTEIDSLELELNLEPETTDSTKKVDNPLNDDFPEVDETVITQTNNETEKKTDFIDEIQSNDLEDSPLELTDDNTVVESAETIKNETTVSNDNILSNDENQNKTETEAFKEPVSDKSELPPNSMSEAIPETTAEPTAEPEAPAKSPVQPADEQTNYKQAQQKANGKIENEQALSALINKSNQHSRSEKLKKNITIGILITLILIGSGLYFYIEMQTTSQDLYIAQNNTAVNRQPNIQNVTPAPAQQPLSSPNQNVIQPKNTISQIRPTTKTPVVTKARPAQQPSSQPISIVRTTKKDPIHVLLRDAYNAFHNEDYRKSESLYQKVKKREPNNRDALLGLAAIGIKEKRFEYARQKYQFILKLNPRDSLATAGMSSIESRVDPQLNESQLKFMLKQQPDSAHLYFALGSQYSSQNKWAEAQSSFFSAWSAENKNADYAYNLAVSLDHLDKKKQALDFYRLSLKLKKASSGNFSEADTEQRIHTLQENKK